MPILLVLTLLFTTAQTVQAKQVHELVDSAALAACVLNRPGDPMGLVAFRLQDEAFDTLLSDAKLHMQGARLRRGFQVTHWQCMWSRNRTSWATIECSGYPTVLIDSLSIPADTLTVVTVHIPVGDGVISSEEAYAGHVSVDRCKLDALLPLNEVIGKVIDHSTGMPVIGARVYCESLMRGTVTDLDGDFALCVDTLRLMSLHVWHPLYDSIRVQVGKHSVYSRKEVDIHFECQRDRDALGGRYFTDSTALISTSWQAWIGFWGKPGERKQTVYTYAVPVGQAFGIDRHWMLASELPFRLVCNLNDRRALVQFSQAFREVSERQGFGSNVTTVTDIASKLMSNSRDGGVNLELRLQPDYAPRNRISPDMYARMALWELPDPVRDSCFRLRVELDRLHLQNFFRLLAGDLVYFATNHISFGQSWDDEFSEPLTILPPDLFEELLDTTATYHLHELFALKNTEIYIHGSCDEPCHDRFARLMFRSNLDSQEGDAYVRFVPAEGSPWKQGWSAVYRYINGRWITLAME